MHRFWEATTSGYRFDARTLGGAIDARVGAAEPLTGRLERPALADGARIFELKRFNYKDAAGRNVSATPHVGAAYIQEACLFVEQPIETDAGMQLTIRFTAAPDALDAEFRVQTIAPAQSMTVVVGFAFPARKARLPLAGAESIEADYGPPAADVVQFSSDQGRPLTLLCDLGASGSMSIRRSLEGDPIGGTEATCHLFQQPLEKGVIVVGRLSLRAGDGLLSSESARRLHESWSARRAFL